MNQIKDRGAPILRLTVLAISCVVFILCGITVSASRAKGKHKDILRLSAGLKGVKESAKKSRARLSALEKREEVLLSKIDEATDQEVAGDEGGNSTTLSFAKVELEKIRYEKRALTKKIRTCEINKKCILAEIAVVSEVAPEPPEANEIQFQRPIKGQITSGFGLRMHPLDHVEKPHQGLDLAGDIGDTVCCAANGKVIFAGVQRGYGNIIIIQHSPELASAYGHLSKIIVKVGEAVARGEEIGEVGMTGNSTGPHLHFEIRENGSPVNPINYL